MRSPDYEEFLKSLNAHGVRYLVVGAHAVAFSHVATQYLSLEDLIREKENAGRDQDRADVANLKRISRSKK